MTVDMAIFVATACFLIGAGMVLLVQQVLQLAGTSSSDCRHLWGKWKPYLAGGASSLHQYRTCQKCNHVVDETVAIGFSPEELKVLQNDQAQ